MKAFKDHVKQLHKDISGAGVAVQSEESIFT